MPFDDDMTFYTKKAYEEGFEAGKKEPRTPPIPADSQIRRPSSIVPTCDCFVEKGMNFDRGLGLHRCARCGQFEDYSNRTAHQQRIDEFMTLAGQQLPMFPILPGEDVRRFRAAIILEEALETIKALGFTLLINVPNAGYDGGFSQICQPEWISISQTQVYEPSLVEIADGCGDLSVVTIGTLTACGIADQPVLEAVDQNNLNKFKPRCPNCKEEMKLIKTPEPGTMLTGSSVQSVVYEHEGWSCWSCETHYPKEVGGYRRDDGKWVKGTVHRKVDLATVLAKQGQR